MIVKLIRLERAGNLRREPVGDAVIRFGRVRRDVGGRDDDVGPVGAQQVDLFPRHLVGHHEDAAIAANRGGHGQAGARIAAGRFDDRSARLEQALALGGIEHRDCRAIFDAAAGINVLDLGKHEACGAVGDFVELDERRVADRFKRVFAIGEAGRADDGAVLAIGARGFRVANTFTYETARWRGSPSQSRCCCLALPGCNNDALPPAAGFASCRERRRCLDERTQSAARW